jgi:hypothetical protein
MTPAQFAAYIRKQTKTNSTTFPDADILLYANIIKNDLAKEVTKANEDYFGVELKRDLVAGKRNYAFPTYMLNNMKYLQAKLDGTTQQVLKEFDVNTYKTATDEDSILANWAGKSPSFDIYGNEIIIYSDSAIIDVTEGLILWSIIYPADLTSLSGTSDMSENPTLTSFGIPTELHFVWAAKVIIEYKNSKEKPIPLTEREVNVNNDLTLAINSLKGLNLDRSLVATIPDYSNNGQNY